MCGFIYQERKRSKFDINKLQFKKASKLIYHRGPDSKNFVFDNNVNIFHARLKIIDLNKRSNQPMKRLGYSILFNGEIYNFKKLKQELSKDFIFETNSDTEVLLFSFIKWKEKMFDKINGMFSFLIFNQKEKLLFFARDLFGQKPLYYINNKNQIIFSSEIKPILKLKKSKKIQFDDKEIFKYLNFNYYCDSEQTFFKSIQQIKPGTYGYFKNNKLIFKNINYKSNVAKINSLNLTKLLKNEIEDHLVSDVETAIMISEGIDSKSILDISKKLFHKKLKLFNLEFEGFNNDEFKNEYHKKEKSNLIITKFLKKDLFKELKNASAACETPPLGLFTLGMMKLFRNIKSNKIKVVLNGQGVDEIFGGYNSFYMKKLEKNLYHPDGSILSAQKNIYKRSIISKKISHKNLKSQIKYMAFESKIPKNLNQYDKISMNYSVECRSPYLTKNLASLIGKLKINQLTYNNHNKYLFRKSLYNLTKDKFYFNEKKFKQAPQTEFMMNKINLLKINKIIKNKNYCDKYFNKINLLKYLDEFNKSKNNGFVVWQYISLNSFINSFNKFNS